MNKIEALIKEYGKFGTLSMIRPYKYTEYDTYDTWIYTVIMENSTNYIVFPLSPKSRIDKCVDAIVDISNAVLDENNHIILTKEAWIKFKY